MNSMPGHRRDRRQEQRIRRAQRSRPVEIAPTEAARTQSPWYSDGNPIDGPNLTLSPRHGSRRGTGEIALMRRAVREDWPLTPEQRERIIDRLMRAVDSDHHGIACKAAQVLVAADNINAKRESADTHERTADQAALQRTVEHIARTDPELYQRLIERWLAAQSESPACVLQQTAPTDAPPA